MSDKTRLAIGMTGSSGGCGAFSGIIKWG